MSDDAPHTADIGSNPMRQGLRSNVQFWQELQEEDYFENHPCYQGLKVAGGEESILAIERFTLLQPDMRIVVVGCGYGREIVKLAPRVDHVYGIDVSRRILDKTVGFLAANGISNFTPITCDRYTSDIPDNINLVFSIVVMQHLTRDLVSDYFCTLGRKLMPGGSFVVQFLEELFDGVEKADAALEKHEPSVSWTLRQIAELIEQTGLEFVEVVTIKVTPTALWHWVYSRRGLEVSRGHTTENE